MRAPVRVHGLGMVPAGRRVVAAALALLVVAAPARAQAGRVLGVVIDSLSLRTALPGEGFRRIAGANVSLGAGARRVVADSLGRFAFDSVPPGTHRVQYWGAWLDRVGLGPLVGEVEVLADSTVGVVLATPSFATYHRLQCDAPPEEGFGVLIGEVMAGDGAPMPGARVAAAWQETRIERGLPVRALERREAEVRATGEYILCGVPQEVLLDLTVTPARARAPATALGVLVAEGIERRDVLVGSGREPVLVTGVVTDSLGRALANATVLTREDSVLARTDTAGRFTARLRGRGSRQVVVRAIGHEPRMVDVEARGDEVALAPVALSAVALGLDTVRVVGRADPRDWRRGFEERRSLGVGAQITEAQIRELPRLTSAAVAMLARRVRVNRGSLWLARGTGHCPPRWYVDGNDERRSADHGPGWEQAMLDIATSVEIYTAAQAPARYTDFDGCGVIVVWTR